MSEDGVNRAMLETVRQFATDLSQLKQEEQEERAESKRYFDQQLTVLRTDMYGSILLLDQQVTALVKANEKQGEREKERQQREDEHRQREADERARGQRRTRWVLIGILVALVALAVLAGIILWIVGRTRGA